MAVGDAPSYAELLRRLARAECELAESRERVAEARVRRAAGRDQQAATGEILREIANTPADLRAVPDTLAEHAARLCGADDARTRLVRGDALRPAAAFGGVPGPGTGRECPPHRGSTAGRAALDRAVARLRDPCEDAGGMTTTPRPIVALWAVPRSVSTAFERMIMARGDFAVFHEPFSGYYYFSRDRVSDRYCSVSPLPSHGHQAMLDELRAASSARPVFFKDMAYHTRNCLTPSFLALFTNTFLIRHPRHVLPSLYKLLPDFTHEEAGYSIQHRMFALASGLQAATPIVIDADDLCRSPSSVVREYCRAIDVPYLPQALTWTAGSRPEWARWERWHLEASDSTGFYQRPAHDRDRIDALPHLRAAYDHCLPFYLELYERRLRVESNTE